MFMSLTRQFDAEGPIRQASRCLDLWLKEERRAMDRRHRRRTAALMARYFYNEDQVTDQLLLSFLRHYAGWKEIDIEDPASVRQEIKILLDKSKPREVPRHMLSLTAGMVLMALVFCGWNLSQRKITLTQQEDLKKRVELVVAAKPQLTRARIWAEIKKPLEIRSYQQMSYWDYKQTVERLEAMSCSGAGM